MVADWLGITHGAGPSLSFVRFEGRERDPTEENKAEAPLPLFLDVKVLEIGAPFTNLRYHDLWQDLKKVGPQLATLCLEVTGGMDPRVAKSVKRLVEARFETGEDDARRDERRDEEEAKKFWGELQAGLNIDPYLSAERPL